jgi:hypothetical protein
VLLAWAGRSPTVVFELPLLGELADTDLGQQQPLHHLHLCRTSHGTQLAPSRDALPPSARQAARTLITDLVLHGGVEGQDVADGLDELERGVGQRLVHAHQRKEALGACGRKEGRVNHDGRALAGIQGWVMLTMEVLPDLGDDVQHSSRQVTCTGLQSVGQRLPMKALQVKPPASCKL